MFAIPAFASDSVISIELDRANAQVGDRINATIRVENITGRFINIPIHFNPDVVQVVDSEGNLVLSGVRTAAEVRNGSVGLTPEQALSNDLDNNYEPLFWNGAIFENPQYPAIDNEAGFVRLLFSNTQAKEILNETLITIHFIAVGEGEADIRFAVQGDAAYDPTSPLGAMYFNAENTPIVPQFSVQNIIVTSSDMPVERPPVQEPNIGGSGDNFTTVTVIPPVTESDVLEYVVSERMIENNMARATGETEYTMSIRVEVDDHIRTIIIKLPVLSVVTMLENAIFYTEFNTPLGGVRFEHWDIIDNMTTDSQFVIVTISETERSVTIDGIPLVIVSNNADFADLPLSHWAHNYIISLVEREILNGISETEFAPDANVTREQFARMLVMTLGIYAEDATAYFYDLPVEHWAYISVASAVNAGIILGFDDGTFGTGQNISRQEMAVMVQRAIENMPQTNTSQVFTDQLEIADWAIDAVIVIQEAGIINGFEDGTFRPTDNATRAQAARIIYAVLELLD